MVVVPKPLAVVLLTQVFPLSVDIDNPPFVATYIDDPFE
jgi:hypothetical protein